MPTLMPNVNPKSRVDSGDAVLSAAATISTAPIKVRLTGFAKAHRAYCVAETAVQKASSAVRKQEALVGELDAAQDADVIELASALAGDGMSRTRPFKALGFGAPSVICKMGTKEESKLVTQLAAKVASKAGLGPKSKAAAKRAAVSAAKVAAALKPLDGLRKAHKDAITRRDALALPWEKSFSALKRAAKSAADDGHVGIFETLFVTTVRAPKPKPASKPNGVPAPAPTP